MVPGATKALEYGPNSGLDVKNTRWIVPCNTTITLELQVGGKSFKMNTRDGIMVEKDMCFGAVEANDDGFYRVGSPFLRNVYT
jgi:hypothetical protein